MLGERGKSLPRKKGAKMFDPNSDYDTGSDYDDGSDYGGDFDLSPAHREHLSEAYYSGSNEDEWEDEEYEDEDEE